MATTFKPNTSDPNTYSISQFQYPDNLCDDTEYAGHKVVFFINIQAGGSIAKKGTDGYDFTVMPGSDVNPNAPDSQIKGDTIGNLLDVLKPKRRLLSAIALYIPNSLVSSYSVQWSEESSEDMIGGETLARTLLKSGDENVAAAASSYVGSTAGTAAAKLLQSAQALGGYAATKVLNGLPYAQKALGVTPGQSKAQQLFRGVNFRDFNFSYTFAPKSEAEAENVLNIIKMFKYHMLPEFFDSQQYLYIYPSEFDIKYFIKDVENKYIEKQATAVLTNLSVNYTPNNQFMTFENGMPTHIVLDLSFKELAMASKETQPIPDFKAGS